MSTSLIVKQLKEHGEDHEWYPTTNKMLDVIKQHLAAKKHRNVNELNIDVLDCGAGNGKVLDAISGNGKKYSIEKSPILARIQANDIVPVGTDFHRVTLIDKAVGMVFSNPPYSEFELWATKIIREANAPDVYLVVPQRWKQSKQIEQAISARKATVEVIHSDNFLDAERQARAVVDVLHIDLSGNFRGYSTQTQKIDPFEIWFDENFPKKVEKDEKEEHLKARVENQMVSGKNLIEILVSLYQQDMVSLQQNYTSICSLDTRLMEELGIKHHELAVAVKQKIKGLKNKYWKEFFDKYSSITGKLATRSRSKVLNLLNENTSVDFDEENAYAITLWVIKNANAYYDSQLIDLVETMTKQANVSLYKSNKRVYGDEDWRYSNWSRSNKIPEDLTHYMLDYRIVLEHMGGISNSQYSWDRERFNGLGQTSAEFISDVLCVAETLSYKCNDTVLMYKGFKREWQSNRLEKFYTTTGQLLFDVRAFKNGNLHIRFDTKFIKKLNVEFGRLKGWLKDKKTVCDEMLDVSHEEADEFFNSTLKLSSNNVQLLLTN